MESIIPQLFRVTEAATLIGFVLLATLAVARAPHAGRAGWWMASAFGSLALGLAVIWVPGWVGRDRPGGGDDLMWILILVFPYLLLRFTATFRPLPRPIEVAAAGGGVVALILLLFTVLRDRGGSEVPAAVYLAVVLLYWSAVAGITVVRLWRAGAGQPGVARRRLRLMATATALLTVALITVVGPADGAPMAELGWHLLAVGSATAFALGFAPPLPLRLAWRQAEDRQLQTTTTALLRADTASEVAAHLLPATVAIMGASRAAILGPDGRTVAEHRDGRSPDVTVKRSPGRNGGPVRESASLGPGHGHLVAWTSSYTPFFGPEEVALFRSVAAVGALALERCALLEEERAQRAILEDARRQSDVAREEAERAQQEATAANLAKSQFLSRMSHELRTPLNAILGFGQLLEMASLAVEDEDGVAHIMKAGRHLLALIDDVLDLSRIEAGALTLSLEPVAVDELIADSFALIRPLASARSISVEADLQGCTAFVLTDRQRCRQALLNLLSNAVKYNRDDGKVEVTCTELSGDRLRIAVRDTGPGIDPSQHERLFVPFERLGAERSGVDGTGLGLALTKQLLDRLDGDIGVTSEPGEGSTFWIELPTVIPPEAPTPDAPGITTAPAGHGAELRQLLLVEDNLANLQVVEAMLRRRPGISVLPAMQGSLALELAYEHRPDVIVLDLHLPDLTGREVFSRLRADPRTRDIPVIVASADATASSIRQLREDGVFDYVTKPLDLAVFLETIDRALSSRN